LPSRQSRNHLSDLTGQPVSQTAPPVVYSAAGGDCLFSTVILMAAKRPEDLLLLVWPPELP